MSLLMRLTCFFIILIVQFSVNQFPAKIGKKIATPFLRQIQLTALITIAALGGGGLFWLYYNFLGIDGTNEVVMLPFLIGLMSLLTSGCLLVLTRKKITSSLQPYLLVLPLAVNLTLIPEPLTGSLSRFWYLYLLSLLFFFVVSLVSAGIMERIKIAPIPPLLQGLPIQFTVLMLIFLSLSFFKGVFFTALF